MTATLAPPTESRRMELPPDAAPILGQFAVEHSRVMNHAMSQALLFKNEGSGDGYDAAMYAANEAAARVHEELTLTRAVLTGLSPTDRAISDEYLSHRLVIDEIAEAGFDSPTAWLADGERGATDQRLLQILEDHVDEIMSRRLDTDVASLINAKKDQQIEVLEEGIINGFVSPNARRTFYRVRNARIGVGDVWNQLIQTHKGGGAYNPRGTDVAVIGQREKTGQAGKEQLLTDISDVAGHDLVHVEFSGDNYLPRYEDEALAEFLDLSLRYGGPDAMGPWERKDAGLVDHQRMVWERAVFNAKLQWGKNKISPRFALLAYTSGDSESPEWYALEAQIDTSWGIPNFSDQVANRVKWHENNLRRDNPELSVWVIQGQALEATINELLAEARRLHGLPANSNAQSVA